MFGDLGVFSSNSSPRNRYSQARTNSIRYIALIISSELPNRNLSTVSKVKLPTWKSISLPKKGLGLKSSYLLGVLKTSRIF
jgi:hypothetical protein